MAASTEKQRIQQALAWKLRIVRGSIGTLYPREPELSNIVSTRLHIVVNNLREVETELVKALHEIK